MTIKEYIPTVGKIVISGVPFRCSGTNQPSMEDKDVNEKLHFDDDEYYSFLERLERAKEEIAEVFMDDVHDIRDAYKKFKEQTEEGNINFWGCWFSVYTKGDEPGDEVLFDVRLD